MAQKQIEIMDAASLNKAITEIGKIGNRLNTKIQIAAINAIWYANEKSDIGFGQRLLLAMNAGQRKNSLVAFLEKHGKFRWDKESKQLVYRKRDDVTGETALAIAKPWFEALKEPEIVSTVSFEDWFKSMMKRMETAIKDGKTIKAKQLYEASTNLWAEYQASLITEDADDEQLSVEEEIAQLMPLALEAEEATPNRQPLAMAA